MYRLNFLVPESHLEAVKSACIEAGAGKIGSYEKCAWQTLGTGQYQPSKASNPYKGSAGQLETAREYSVDMVIAGEYVRPVINALLAAHPYEVPAYSVWKILTINDFD